MADELGADAGTGLRALGVNCTLKKTPETSHTEALMNRVLGILEEHGVETEIFRPVDYDIKFGVSSDEGDGDEWPQLLEKFKAADIILMGMSIWFGVRSSVCQMVVERLDGTYNERNEVGQYPLYNRVGDAGPGPSYLDAGGPDTPTRSGRARGAPTTSSTWPAFCARPRSRRSATHWTRWEATRSTPDRRQAPLAPRPICFSQSSGSQGEARDAQQRE